MFNIEKQRMLILFGILFTGIGLKSCSIPRLQSIKTDEAFLNLAFLVIGIYMILFGASFTATDRDLRKSSRELFHKRLGVYSDTALVLLESKLENSGLSDCRHELFEELYRRSLISDEEKKNLKIDYLMKIKPEKPSRFFSFNWSDGVFLSRKFLWLSTLRTLSYDKLLKSNDIGYVKKCLFGHPHISGSSGYKIKKRMSLFPTRIYIPGKQNVWFVNAVKEAGVKYIEGFKLLG